MEEQQLKDRATRGTQVKVVMEAAEWQVVQGILDGLINDFSNDILRATGFKDSDLRKSIYNRGKLKGIQSFLDRLVAIKVDGDSALAELKERENND